MARVHGSHVVDVRAPRSVCIELLVDAAGYPAWYETLDRVEVIEFDSAGRPGVVDVTADAGPLGALRFTLRQSYALPHGVEGEQVGGDGRLVNVRNRWTLDELDGGTRVAYEMSVDAAGFAANALLRTARALVERDLIRGFAESLKRAAETRT